MFVIVGVLLQVVGDPKGELSQVDFRQPARQRVAAGRRAQLFDQCGGEFAKTGGLVDQWGARTSALLVPLAMRGTAPSAASARASI